MRHARDDYNRFQDPAGIVPEDEPVFLIRGKDKAGPPTLRNWAYHAQRLGASPAIVEKAFQWAAEMERYQAETGNSQVPDLPEEVPNG